MAARDELLTALSIEVLGPRRGPREHLDPDEDPRNEYISGVLGPRISDGLTEAQRSDDAEDVILGEDDSARVEEDQDEGEVREATPLASPALDPRARPVSMGVTVALRNGVGAVRLAACATWARYHQDASGWARRPDMLLTGTIQPGDNLFSSGNVALHMRANPVDGGGTWRVSLFLVNEQEPSGSPGSDGKPRAVTEDFVFQPEIRVRLLDGTVAVPVDEAVPRAIPGGTGASVDPEDATLNLLYRDRRAFARGHLAGAVWRAIDPQRQPGVPQRPPFIWEDAVAVPEPERSLFVDPDLRTEMVPMAVVALPELTWPAGVAPAPILAADELAEMWDPARLSAALTPLVDGYAAWIRDNRATAAGNSTAGANFDRCQAALDRIRAAITVLRVDPRVRLAFNFANRAIDRQFRWSRGTAGTPGLHWFPYQLAFILMNLPAIIRRRHPDRGTCDLLWMPTGGGKTEAYLALAAFTMAYRRTIAPRDADGLVGPDGTAVLSRYTLRLLTTQQFRRALRLVTACESLRVEGLESGAPVGWRPSGCPDRSDFIWGTRRFSAGLWVGGGVTPNRLQTHGPMPNGRGGLVAFVGAIGLLKGDPEQLRRRGTEVVSEGEPAQVLQCPCCGEILAVPQQGLPPGQSVLHLIVRAPQGPRAAAGPVRAIRNWIASPLPPTQHENRDYWTLGFEIDSPRPVTAAEIDRWWGSVRPMLGADVELVAARASRPGYFIRRHALHGGGSREYDFEIFCPNPACGLNRGRWAERVPVPDVALSVSTPSRRDVAFWNPPAEPFRAERVARPMLGILASNRIPIPAYTVDEQIYGHCPSLVVGTADKIARLPYEPGAASMFGNVDRYHPRYGYYREWAWDGDGNTERANPGGAGQGHALHREVDPFAPPDLILQDELHLIEGPLGSMFGLYEAAVDSLAGRPKYVASTATVRSARDQVQSLFDRNLAVFPPPGLVADETFFMRPREAQVTDSTIPGRLYLGVCAPGRGAQTPIVRIWARLLQRCYELVQAGAGQAEIDPYWTLVGYFNAIRELAGVVALYRQDIPDRIRFIAHGGAAGPRNLHVTEADTPLELSSRRDSTTLPALLERLTETYPRTSTDAAVCTSMFGTGVDVPRLSLMVVHGQPKSTSAYIQATGRVGRAVGGLVVVFLRAARPRDLDHYEFFTGYHAALHRHVEPATVAPFAPRARERALGPVAVALLRNAAQIAGFPVDREWSIQQRVNRGIVSHAERMATHRRSPEVMAVQALIEARGAAQPAGRRPTPVQLRADVVAELDSWANLAGAAQANLLYDEPAMLSTPMHPVVLGNHEHWVRNLDQAYENAPQSLRDVEATTGFRT